MKPRVFKDGGLWFVQFEFAAVPAVSWREAVTMAFRCA